MQMSISLLLEVPHMVVAEVEKLPVFFKAIAWLFAFSFYLNEAMNGKMSLSFSGVSFHSSEFTF